MAKRELSSTLKNLKFMQRAAQREEKSDKKEEIKNDWSFPSSSIPKKCIVIMEGDTHPGATKGRMSFHSFNPSIDKLNEDATNVQEPEASASCSGNEIGNISDRENASIQHGSRNLKPDSFKNDANGDLKRKQAEVVPEMRSPNKPQKNVQDDQQSVPNNNRSSHKKSKREKLDWNVLRPPKCQSKRG